MINRLTAIPVLLLALTISISCSNNFTQADAIEKSVDSLISKMTLEDKIGMIHASSSFTSGGLPRLGIPELVMSDGPHGVRFEHGRDWTPDKGADDESTYLPTGICLASTWNTELGYQYGRVLGSEARERGKDIILGPGVNIIRTPLNGRNFEYLSEDPYLNSRMAVEYIKGVQDQGTAACVKHYLANNQETNRSGIDVRMSERTLREIYLPAFKASVEEAGVLSVMGAYNKYDGQYATHHKYLVNELLKEEMGFDGLLMSDWSAVHDTREALLYGTDIEMGTDLIMRPKPDYNKFYMADSALAIVSRGEVDESVVDEKVRRILRVMYRIGEFGERPSGERNTPEHQQVALKVAEEGIVLLKNDNILPLDVGKIKKLAVIGDNATRRHAHQGGSSQVHALYEITPLEGIKTFVGNEVEVQFARGYVPTKENKPNENLIRQAVNIAADADAVVFVGGWIHSLDGAAWGKDSWDMEGIDKQNLEMLFGQEALLKAIIKANPNTVVVLIGGGPVDMNGWTGRVKAILQAWYPGMEGGHAIANILFGKTNPSGKLPMTFAKKLEDYPSHSIGEFPGKNMVVNYSEGIYVGYRYFDSYDIEPLFCFGHGLSYTKFEYSNLNIKRDGDLVTVSCMITNTGDREGAETVQFYIRKSDPSIERAFRELKGFRKIALTPGQSASFMIKLEPEAFRYYDESEMAWRLEPGKYELQVGSSSRDIRLTGQLLEE